MNSNISLQIIEDLLPNNTMGKDLFHYTSSAGLQGILESKKLHCSHIFFLNDYEENLNIWKFYFNALEKWTHEDSQSAHFINALKHHFSIWKIFNAETISMNLFKQFKVNNYLLFVFSLSHTEDDLSQWRSYTDSGGSGFSLKFNLNSNFLDTQSVFKESGTDDISFSECKVLVRDCVYRSSEKNSIIYKLLDFTFERYKGLNHQWANELFFNLLTLSIFFKNEKFEGENECRIAVLPSETLISGTRNENLLFKKGKSFLIPYIALDITPNILKSVYVGPTPFPDHSLASINMILKKYKDKYGPIGSIVSKIPYRYW